MEENTNITQNNETNSTDTQIETNSNTDSILKTDESKKDGVKLSPEEELAKMRVEMLKLKKALDKSSSDTANFKRQLRERQSADEIALQEKAEKEAAQQAEIEQLRKENAINKLAKSFLALGYSDDMAEKAANAQYENDTDLLFEIQRAEKARQEQIIKDEMMKSMPTSNISNKEVQVTSKEFSRMNYLQRYELKQKNPELFKKLNGLSN